MEELIAALLKKKTLSEMAGDGMKKLQAMEVNVRKDRQEFLRELFREQSDPIELIKKKDLHELLEEALSRTGEMTQILARVLLKNT